MKMGKLWTLLCFVLMVTLVGCSKDDTANLSSTYDESYESSYEQNIQTPEIDYDADLDSDQNESNEELDVFIYSGEKFSEGLAWVLYYLGDDSDKRTRGLLKITGEIIPVQLPVEIDGYIMGSDFYGGYSFLNYTQGDQLGFFIINDKGECVLQNETDAGYTVLCGGDGWFLIKKSIRSMEKSEDLFGIITVDGEWVYEPQSEFMYGPEQGEQRMLDVGANYFYLGNGIFRAQWYPGNAGRNIPLNVVLDAKTETYNPIELPLDSYYESVVEGVYDDTVIWSYSSSYRGSAYKLNWDGTSTELAFFEHYDWVDIKLGDGIIYVADEEQSQFIDLNGNVLIDMSQYSINAKKTLCEFSNGFAAVVINGEDGFEYLKIIDETGFCSFEPIRLDYSFYYVDGKMACVFHDNPDTVSWIDADGNIESSTLDIYDMEELTFGDGYAFNFEDKSYISYMGDRLTVSLQ